MPRETVDHPQDEYVLQVGEAASFIRQVIKANNLNFSPHVAVTLGSGLGKLADLIEPVATIPYVDIPHFPRTTVPGHEGTLIAGYLEGVPVLGLKGRKHYYEVAGQPDAMDQVVFPAQVAASLDTRLYVATNAAGGLNPNFKVGDLMVIRSHNGLFFPNALIGTHHDFHGNNYFQPLNDLYPKTLRDFFRGTDSAIHEGVYAAVTGRTFETQAECIALRLLGADAVGMSTVPEMIIAHNRRMQTLGVSIITNVIAEDGTNATNHEEVMAILNSKDTEEKLLAVFRSFFQKISFKN